MRAVIGGLEDDDVDFGDYYRIVRTGSAGCPTRAGSCHGR